jgi:hypothetical protein
LPSSHAAGDLLVDQLIDEALHRPDVVALSADLIGIPNGLDRTTTTAVGAIAGLRTLWACRDAEERLATGTA